MRRPQAPGSLHPLFAAITVTLLMLGTYGGSDLTTAIGWLGALAALVAWGYLAMSSRQ
ncbi:hypothetical protein [uncultured Aeromicrobium sp.]|uniref:hypothetical protein n=1 Tax=uncultured Aeromicrobium sp. TaxID=337820 RepID=UPI0025E2FA8F|nr:hypothetical protein [uncultured Aeromicrobium sp.]